MSTQLYSIKTFNNSSIVSVHEYVKLQGTGYTACPSNYTFQFHKRNIFVALHFPCSVLDIKLLHTFCIIMILSYLYALNKIIRFLNDALPQTIDILILLKPLPLKSRSLFIHCTYLCSSAPVTVILPYGEWPRYSALFQLFGHFVIVRHVLICTYALIYLCP